jgi:hypothetical protein
MESTLRSIEKICNWATQVPQEESQARSAVLAGMCLQYKLMIDHLAEPVLVNNVDLLERFKPSNINLYVNNLREKALMDLAMSVYEDHGSLGEEEVMLSQEEKEIHDFMLVDPSHS